MPHSQKELDKIYQHITSADFKNTIDATPERLAIYPKIVYTDPDGTVLLSVPIRNGTARAIYKKPPGGFWVEDGDPDPLTFFAADSRSAAMKVTQDGFRLIRKARPNADPDLIVQAIARAFEQLNNNQNAVISPEAIFQHAIKTIV